MNLSCCLCTDAHTLQTTKQVYLNIKTFGFYPNWGVLWCFCFSLFFFFHFCLVTILFKGNPSFSVFTIITRYLNLHIWRYLRDPHLKPVFFWFIFLSNVTISRIYVQKHPLSGDCPEYVFFPTSFCQKVEYSTILYKYIHILQYSMRPSHLGPKSFTDGKDPE